MKNLICGDNLDVLKSGAIDAASVDLIYLDPPFNSNQYYNLPFTKLGKESAAVEAFNDIWSWDEATRELEKRLKTERQTIAISTYINDVKVLRGGEDSLSAYLINIAIRLNEMKRVLKSTGSIFLHCDPKASHYLKILMDNIFGASGFRNELIWCYTGPGSPGVRQFLRKHDNIFWYSVGKTWTFNVDDVRIAHSTKTKENYKSGLVGSGFVGAEHLIHEKGKVPEDWWQIAIAPRGKEYLGYPTQKPLALLRRIIAAASSEDDVVLDPFCGCGTAVHAAEELHRNWIGIDISRYAVGVIKNRLKESFESSLMKQVALSGIPTDVESALELARDNPWEFEKWACGQLGAKGLYKRPGAKGSDGGIDGVIEFYADPANKSYAIVQVKGGTVKPNDVKALYSDVDSEPRASAGIFVCFDRFKRTAKNNASTRTFTDNIAGNEWPTVQILTIEEMLAGKMPKLPNQVIQQGFRTSRAEPVLI